MQFNSIKFKITILYTAALGTLLVVYSAILYFSLSYTLYVELDQELKNKAQEIEQIVTAYSNTSGLKSDAFLFGLSKSIGLKTAYPQENTLSDLDKNWLKRMDKYDIKQDYIVFWNQEQTPLVKSENVHPAILSCLKDELNAETNEINFQNTTVKKRNLRTISFPATYHNTHYIIQIATSLKPIISILANRSLYILSSIPIILFLSALIGRFLVLRILRPILKITNLATSITHDDLSERIELSHVDTEIQYLINAFNEMIARLEKSFKHIGDFSSNVAHELKTPLAIIRGECEVALRKERSSEEYKRVLRTSIEEIQRMLKTVDDLLLLTKLEYRPENFPFDPIDINKFITEIYEQTKILALTKNITVKLNIPSQNFQLKGNLLALRQLFFNLISNAIKFTPKQGNITINIEYKHKKAIISIADTGIGIKENDLPKIFNRFFHTNYEENNKDQGNGLGLSIVSSIANIHNGTINVTSQPDKGTTFHVAFPFYE